MQEPCFLPEEWEYSGRAGGRSEPARKEERGIFQTCRLLGEGEWLTHAGQGQSLWLQTNILGVTPGGKDLGKVDSSDGYSLNPSR